jgi:signal transduction histidine kinase
MNLLVNAAQAVCERGEVLITTRLVEERVAVIISDTGDGIAPEHPNKIFDPSSPLSPSGRARGLACQSPTASSSITAARYMSKASPHAARPLR